MENLKVVLNCINPQGAVELPLPLGLVNPRVKDLTSKKIGIFWDGKKGGDNFCIAVEEQLQQKYPTASIIRLAWGDIAAAEKAKEEIDTFIYGVGDSGMGGWGQCLQVIELEKSGKPGVFVVGDNAIHTAKMSARDAGMPTLRIVSLPSIDYYPNRLTVAGLKQVVKTNINAIVDALTKTLTPEEKTPALIPEKENPATIEITADSYGSVLEKFNQVYLDKHWGDGLPLIPPTEEAVKRMLTGTSRSPDEVIGKVPFRNGIATIKKIAINAVMAGAKPEYLPIIIAAIECLTTENSFSHMMSSEGGFTLAIMITGPIGKEISMNCSVGLLGHGWQANNTIGRAIRLCITNFGYLWPGEIDMALLGRPSPHTFYTFAENIEQSPWESFNEGLGYRPKESCVTLSTVGGTGGMSIKIYGGGVVEPWDVKQVLQNLVKEVASDRAIFAAYKLGVANPFAHFRKHIMVIHPELAIMLKRIGYQTKQSLRDYIYESSKVPYEELTAKEIKGIRDRTNTKPGGMFFVNDAISENLLPLFKEGLKPGGKIPVVNPEDIHIVVSGSIPGYSFGMPYFRGAHQTRVIRGATLTKSGR
jgi:hypothetical protein